MSITRIDQPTSSSKDAKKISSSSGLMRVSIFEQQTPPKEDPNVLLKKAALSGSLKQCQLALSHGADVNHQENNNFTALMLAARQGHAGLVSALLEAKANPNILDKYNRTALMVAVQQAYYCNPKVVLKLINITDLSQTDAVSGHTAYQTAMLFKDNVNLVLIFRLFALRQATREDPTKTDSDLLLPGWAVGSTELSDAVAKELALSAMDHPKSKEPKEDKSEQKESRSHDEVRRHELEVFYKAEKQIALRRKEKAEDLSKQLPTPLEWWRGLDDSARYKWMGDDQQLWRCMSALLTKGWDAFLIEVAKIEVYEDSLESVGLVDLCRVALQQGANVNYHSGYEPYDKTPIMWAALKGHLGLVKTLLDAKPDLTIKDRHGDTAFTSCWRPEIARVLLASGAELDISKSRGIIYAATDGALDLVKRFLDAGFDINKMEKEEFGSTTYHCGERAIIRAAQNGHLDVIQFLIGKIDVSKRQTAIEHAFLSAASNGHLHVVEAFKTMIPDVNVRAKNGMTALMLAADKGHGEVIKALLRTSGINPNIKNTADGGKIALIYAAQSKVNTVEHFRVTRPAGEQAVDFALPDNSGDTAMLHAVQCNFYDFINDLIQKAGISVPKDISSLFHGAAEKGCVDLLKTLHERGLYIAAYGQDALLAAAKNGHSQVVDWLVGSLGVDCNLKDPKGYTALMLAAQAGHDNIVRLLVNKFKADPNLVDEDNCTALMLAVKQDKRCNPDVVRTLAKVTDLSLKDDLSNGTPIRYADGFGYKPIAAILLVADYLAQREAALAEKSSSPLVSALVESEDHEESRRSKLNIF